MRRRSSSHLERFLMRALGLMSKPPKKPRPTLRFRWITPWKAAARYEEWKRRRDEAKRCREGGRMCPRCVAREDAKTGTPQCADCEGSASLVLFSNPPTYWCSDLGCGWWGTLDAACDCCDAPMPSGPTFFAYGIETLACRVCREN